jgi:TRAP-type transport system periplasmic protein
MRALGLTLYLLAAGPAAAATVSLQAAHIYPEDHAWHKGFLKFAEVLRTAPAKDIELVIHPRGTWGGESDYIQSLRQGLLDVAVIPPSAAANASKNLAFLDMMFLWRDREHWKRVVDGPVGERIAEMIEAGTSQVGVPGLKVLGFWGGARRHLLGRKRTYGGIADLVSMRVGVQDNPLNLEIWRALGLSPVAVPLRNSMALMDADIVEGVEAELGNAAALKLTDVAPHITLTTHAITLRPLVLSDGTWKQLTPEQRQIVTQAAAAATALVRELEPKHDDAAVQALRAAGVKFEEFRERAELDLRTVELRRRLADEAGLARLLRAIEEEAAEPKR